MGLPFVGRKFELQQLKTLLKKKTASLVVVKGRRRIGKSRLIEEFSRHYKYYYSFTGLPPTPKTTAQSQRDEFARQLGEQFGIPGLKSSNWGDLFTLLAKQTENKKVLILLDEISWMADKDSAFLGLLKITWDRIFSKNPACTLVLCGSISAWIEENILSNTGFYGRISLELTLEELFLHEANQLLKHLSFKGSNYEKFKLLSVIGCIPWYIEQVQGSMNADDNINRLCFTRDGLLVKEFDKIFSDLFYHKGTWYKKIADVLANGAAGYKEICKKINYPSSGRATEYLENMVQAYFISKDYVWNFKSGKPGGLVKYRLRDNYLRFYMKYIKPAYEKIQKNQLAKVSMASFPGWCTALGLQFENLVLNNRKKIFSKLAIRSEDVVADNPYFQNKTTKHESCQIDYLLQTCFNSFYMCEIKFSRNQITSTKIETLISQHL